MGACFQYMRLDGDLTEEQVRLEFRKRVHRDSYECGNGYPGSFSKFTGLEFTGLAFETFDEAYAYVDEHGAKWGPAVAVRHKKYDMPKSALNHDKKRGQLYQKIWIAEAAVKHANDKARINNRSTTPAYVTKAEQKLEAVKAKIQPKIDERTAKIEASIKNAAAKSTKFMWLLGGWCSS